MRETIELRVSSCADSTGDLISLGVSVDLVCVAAVAAVYKPQVHKIKKICRHE